MCNSDKSGILSDVIWREKLADVIGSMDSDGLGLNRHPLFLYSAAQTTHGPLDDIQVSEGGRAGGRGGEGGEARRRGGHLAVLGAHGEVDGGAADQEAQVAR